MRTNFLICILALSVAVFSSCNKTGPLGPVGPQGPAGPALPGSLKGFINHYDASGAKITIDLAGVVISVDGTSRTATTDANGFYTLTGLTTGVYNLSVQPIAVTYGSISASYGPIKIQNFKFIGGGDQYHTVNLSLIPTGTVSTSVATTGTGAVTITGAVSPIVSYKQSVIVYVGAPSSTTVDATAANFISYYTGSVEANTSTYSVTIPITDLRNLGYQSGDLAYFATYLIGSNLEASHYTDFSTNKTIYTAISASPITSTITVP